jgi:pilus assembly protein CpaF
MVDCADITDRVHDRVLADELGLDPGDRVAGRHAVNRLVRVEAPLLGDDEVATVTEAVLARAIGLGALEPLLLDPAVTDVMVNGGGRVWVERAGRLACTDLVLGEPTVLHLIERVVAPLGLHVDRASPVVDARLPDGSRVHAIVRPLAIDGPCLTIRRFAARPIRLDEVASAGVVALLRWAVAARLNIIVAGGAGAGKTTLLNALAAAIPDGERVVTIEDAAELRLPASHVVRLEARPASSEGVGEVRIRDLVRASLRMRPDRIIVGEVRSGEALDMLQAMNTGHEGSLSTCHANGPADALRRIETMVLMGDVALPHGVVREQLASALDLVVQMGRAADGSRSIIEVAEVGHADDRGALATRPLTVTGRLAHLPDRPARRVAAGDPDPGWLE